MHDKPHLLISFAIQRQEDHHGGGGLDSKDPGGAGGGGFENVYGEDADKIPGFGQSGGAQQGKPAGTNEQNAEEEEEEEDEEESGSDEDDVQFVMTPAPG